MRDRVGAKIPLSNIQNLADQLAHSAMLAKAIGQCGIALWATDLDGEILLSEGGLLERIGLQPGQVVGLNISQFSAHAHWREAVERISEGESRVSFISRPSVEQIAEANSEAHPAPHNPRGVWLQTYSALLSPSGRMVGVLSVSMPITGAHSPQKFSFCPLGECAYENGPKTPS